MRVIDDSLLKEVTSQAKVSARLRMNYNFHQSLDEKCHRFLNALEPGTDIPIHHHKTKDEAFILLKGRVKVMTFDNNGNILESVVLSRESGQYGVDIPKNVWHSMECLESGTVVFECKEGPFVSHEDDGILDVNRM